MSGVNGMSGIEEPERIEEKKRSRDRVKVQIVVGKPNTPRYTAYTYKYEVREDGVVVRTGNTDFKVVGVICAWFSYQEFKHTRRRNERRKNRAEKKAITVLDENGEERAAAVDTVVLSLKGRKKS